MVNLMEPMWERIEDSCYSSWGKRGPGVGWVVLRHYTLTIIFLFNNQASVVLCCYLHFIQSDLRSFIHSYPFNPPLRHHQNIKYLARAQLLKEMSRLQGIYFALENRHKCNLTNRAVARMAFVSFWFHFEVLEGCLYMHCGLLKWVWSGVKT